MTRSLVLFLATFVACTGPTSDDSDTDETVDTDTDTSDCEPLALAAEHSRVSAWGVVMVAASGGSGEYRYRLDSPDSGASIDPSTGRVLAGGEVGTTYTVHVDDVPCDATASVDLDVVAPLTVMPLTATVPPDATFEIEVVGGVGEPECILFRDGSGAALSGCTYTAGQGAGTDRIQVVDSADGTSVTTTYVVEEGAQLELHGQVWMLPVGAWLVPTANSGSGHLDVSVRSGSSVSVDSDGVVHAVEAGSSVLWIQDHFTGQGQEVVAHVAGARIPDDTVDGALGNTGAMLGGHDLDGDGYDDVIFGLQEANVFAQGSGALMVVRGGPDGLQDDPLVLGDWLESEDEGGRAMALADFDQDGILDLAWSAEAVSSGDNGNGAVYLHKGVSGGLFEEVPYRTLSGERGFDRFGSGVVACDVDGDGYDDLVVSAYAGEDRSDRTVFGNQGAIYVFRGRADGLDQEALQVRYGVRPDGSGGWNGMSNAQLGRFLAGGDVNGDGRCDIAAGSEFADLESGDAGLVWLYTGEESPTLLSDEPAAFLTPVRNDNNIRFGHSLALGDVDADGKDELVVGGWLMSPPADGGRVYVYDDTQLSGGAWLDETDARVVVGANTNYDYLGASVGVVDLDEDGAGDLVIGALRDETDTSEVEGGVIWRLPGADIRMDETTEYVALTDLEPLLTGHRDSYLGQLVGDAGDVNGDGERDLFAFAGRDSTYGVQTGAMYIVDRAGPVGEPLEPTLSPSDHGFGDALMLFDVTGDGTSDLLLGAPGYGVDGRGANAGSVFSYAAARGSFAASAEPVPFSFESWAVNDRLGIALEASDLDGDGRDELIVAADLDGKPTNYSSAVWNNTACGGNRGTAGAVFGLRAARGEGIEAQPGWVAHGPYGGARVGTLLGGFDFNGDGYEDVLAGSPFYNGSRGWAGFVFGRPYDERGTTAVCFEHVMRGTAGSDNFAASMTRLGDLDGDGCDDVALGARAEDVGRGNQGVVRILWGGGPRCGDPQVTSLVGGVANAQAGYALAGGEDIDGDGVADLVVGAPLYVYNGSSVGAVWLVSGAYLRDLPRQTLPTSGLPEAETTEWVDLVPASSGRALVGDDASGLFGISLALVPDPAGRSTPIVLVGTSSGDVGSGLFAGGAQGYRFDTGAQAFEQAPAIVIAGEAEGRSSLGRVLHAADGASGPLILVGAPDSDIGGPDLGSAYVFPVEGP